LCEAKTELNQSLGQGEVARKSFSVQALNLSTLCTPAALLRVGLQFRIVDFREIPAIERRDAGFDVQAQRRQFQRIFPAPLPRPERIEETPRRHIERLSS
jgi:hypothetical protein